jgi:hypothetical protein
MLEGKARVEDTDMPARMQAAATTAASRALDLFDVADFRGIAGHIKTARPPLCRSSRRTHIRFGGWGS